MSLTFYYLSGSPFSWKIWLALEHKKISYRLKPLSADAGDLQSRDFLNINPWGKAPAIVHNGFVLYESTAIIEYLEETFPHSGSHLWPVDKKQRAVARRIAEEVSNYIYPPVRQMVEELMLKRQQEPDEQIVANARQLVVKNLQILAQNFSGVSNSFMFDDGPGAADFALYPLIAIIARIDNRRPDLELASNMPDAITIWRTAVEALPILEKTMPPHWKT